PRTPSPPAPPLPAPCKRWSASSCARPSSRTAGTSPKPPAASASAARSSATACGSTRLRPPTADAACTRWGRGASARESGANHVRSTDAANAQSIRRPGPDRARRSPGPTAHPARVEEAETGAAAPVSAGGSGSRAERPEPSRGREVLFLAVRVHERAQDAFHGGQLDRHGHELVERGGTALVRSEERRVGKEC